MRKTILSSTVLKIIRDYQHPISVPKLQILLDKQKLTPNKTSLYRLLEKLKNKQLIEEVLINSQTTFYKITNNHHHHFVCENCQQIQCISDEDLEKSIHFFAEKLGKKGLKILSHQFSLFGRCTNCS